MPTDFRAALRGLLRDRVFTLFSVLALALGLGLNGSLLVVSRTFLLQPPPVAQAGSLLEVVDDDVDPARQDHLGSSNAYAAVRDLPDFEGVALASSRVYGMDWQRGDASREVQVLDASAEYLPLLGIRPYLGRAFRPEESGLQGDGNVAMVSYRFWKQALGGGPSAIGQTIVLDGRARTVVGVLPPDFEGHRRDMGAQILVSAAYKVPPVLGGGRLKAAVLARLRPGVSMAQARMHLSSLPWSRSFHLDLQPYQALPPALAGRLMRGLAALHAAALMILIIAICNVLALQSARLHHRRLELALRSALGAQNGDLLRLLFAEHLLMAVLAGLAALGLVAASAPFLQSLQAILPYPPKVHLALGFWSAGATFLLSLATGLFLTLLAMRQARRMDPGRTLQETGPRNTPIRARGAFVAVQAALALVLLCTCVLCLKDLRRQLDVPLGFDLKDRFELSCDPRKANRPRQDLLPLMAPLRERLAAIPGVRSTASTVNEPMGKGMVLRLAGGQVLLCTHELPSLLNLGRLAGRDLERSDEDHARVLVDAGMAQQLWPDRPPLGLHVGPLDQPVEVVGLLQPIRLDGPTQPPVPLLVMPVSREETSFRASPDTILLQVPGSLPSVIRAIQSTAREELRGLPFTLDSLVDLRDARLAQARQMLFLSAMMGALALALSLSGLYGLAAHLAQSRKREFAVRVALGAGPGHILAALARGSLLPIVPGLVSGAGLSIVASRLLVSQNVGFSGLNPGLLAWTCLALGLAASIACLFPALRAMRVDPAEALHDA
jgi:predicted permease